jgi:hypothetical protein
MAESAWHRPLTDWNALSDGRGFVVERHWTHRCTDTKKKKNPVRQRWQFRAEKKKPHVRRRRQFRAEKKKKKKKVMSVEVPKPRSGPGFQDLAQTHRQIDYVSL